MKHLFIIAIFIFAFAAHGKCQHLQDTIRVAFENEKMKVTDYTSTPGKDICGIGKHSHPAHLTICVTDAITTVTTPDGKVQDYSLKAGTTFWSGPVTHIAINNGDKPAQVYLVELK